MGVLVNHAQSLSPWIQRELEFSGNLRKGQRGSRVYNVQEWLCLNDLRVVVDGDFGTATRSAVMEFQRRQRLKQDGVVGRDTWTALVAPLHKTLKPIAVRGRDFAGMTLAYAEQHRRMHPLEIGGQNCGPWVRLYMEGHEGNEWPWCAGFVTFVMKQAAQTLGVKMPIAGSVSCDTLAAQARAANLFVSGSDVRNGKVPYRRLPSASLFLVRRTDSDWTHTGLATSFEKDMFLTIEGNTNDEGSREGYEVCARRRGYVDKDFIRLVNEA